MKGWADIVVPNSGKHIWNAFMELINMRPHRHAPILWSEMKAYLDLTGLEFSPQDVNTLRELDRAYLDAIPKPRKD